MSVMSSHACACKGLRLEPSPSKGPPPPLKPEPLPPGCTVSGPLQRERAPRTRGEGDLLT